MTTIDPIPLVTDIDNLDARVTVLRQDGRTQRRVEVFATGHDRPILSLTPTEASALGFLLRRLGDDASR